MMFPPGHLTSDPQLSMVNGHWSNLICVADRGLAYGDGLFETCRYLSGRVPLWAYHLRRITTDAKKLFLLIDAAQLELELAHFIAGLKLQNFHTGAIKLIVTRGQGGAGVIPFAGSACSVIWQYSEISDTKIQYQEGVHLLIAPIQIALNPNLAGIKHLNRLDYILAAASLPTAGHQQVLLLDAHSHPLETLHHNIFWLQGSVLMTPSLLQCGVAGIMRQLIIEKFAAQLNLTLCIMEFSLADIENADEVFICNSLRGIWPVVQLEQRLWPVGIKTRQLQVLEHEMREFNHEI